MNQLYQQLNKPMDVRAMINTMLQSNPKLRPYMDMIKNGANPRDMFYSLAQQKGIDPKTALSSNALFSNLM